jgi:hypothetical protein
MTTPDVHRNFLKLNQKILAVVQQFGHPCVALPPYGGPISLWSQIAATVAVEKATSQPSGMKHGNVLGFGKTAQRDMKITTWTRGAAWKAFGHLRGQETACLTR